MRDFNFIFNNFCRENRNILKWSIILNIKGEIEVEVYFINYSNEIFVCREIINYNYINNLGYYHIIDYARFIYEEFVRKNDNRKKVLENEN